MTATLMNAAVVVPDLRQILPRDTFTYAVPEEFDPGCRPGSRVEVPFGPRRVTGIVVAREHVDEPAELRSVLAVLDAEPLLPPYLVDLALWIGEHYKAPLGEVIKAMIPTGVRRARATGRRRGPRSQSRALGAARETPEALEPPPLRDEQTAAVAPLLAAVAAGEHVGLLLRGVTGSGKTEVYLAAIDAVLAAGRQAIVLVPEISLTPQTIRRFAGRFPGRLALVHSGLTDAERAAEWWRIRAGDADVVVGSRSAVFSPLARPGIVVVDEEDAAAYKQDRVPRYHAVDVAIELGRVARIPVVLGSATPRVETFFRAHGGDLQLATMTRRHADRPLPPIEVVDLRAELHAGNRSALSLRLQRVLAECQSDGGQSILFLNRRGTATVVLCRDCGEPLMCPNCSVSLVFHASRRGCDCHWCGHAEGLPTHCPQCRSPRIRGLGMGTERLEAEVRDLLPGLRVLRMDRDTVQARDAHFDIYERFRAREADCLIGTQMVAKGWDLAGVRLVGIVNADTALRVPDYRSGEATFSLLTQVAGRAGRGDEPARVILQTYSPEHYAIRHATRHDYLAFAHEEIRVRRALSFPPYARLVVCTVSHADDATAEARARQASTRLRQELSVADGLDVLGPTPAVMHRLRGEYRWTFTVRGPRIERCFPYLPEGRGWAIDVDPQAA